MVIILNVIKQNIGRALWAINSQCGPQLLFVQGVAPNMILLTFKDLQTTIKPAATLYLISGFSQNILITCMAVQ